MERILIAENIMLENKIRISASMPNIDKIDEIINEVSINEKYIIKTPIGKSVEGKQLTGRKLMFSWCLKQNIIYTATKSKTVHVIKNTHEYLNSKILPVWTIYFPTSILKQINLWIEIEDIHHTIIKKREIKESLNISAYIDKTELDAFLKNI